MKVEQFGYLSPQSKLLRDRDGTPPWGVHVCEIDAVAVPGPKEATTGFARAYWEAVALRAELEAE